MAGHRRPHASRRARRARMWICAGARFWGYGYMPEALRAVITYEFTVLGTRRIMATCRSQNPASARVMQKSGMVFERTFDDTDADGHRKVERCYAIRNQGSATE